MRKQLSWLETKSIPAATQLHPSLSLVLALASLAVSVPAAGQAQTPAQEIERSAVSGTDVTFAFTADVHVSFNGHDDHQGILDMVNTGKVPAVNSLLIGNETMPKAGLAGLTAHSDACDAPSRVTRSLGPGNLQ